MPKQLPQHDPRAVANFFILLYSTKKVKSDFYLNPLNLQSIIYLAHLTHVHTFGSLLYNERIDKGAYLPFFPKLKEALQFTSNNETPNYIYDVDPAVQYMQMENMPKTHMQAIFSPEQKRHLTQIWEYSVLNLVDIDFPEKIERFMSTRVDEIASPSFVANESNQSIVNSTATPIPSLNMPLAENGIMDLQRRVQRFGGGRGGGNG